MIKKKEIFKYALTKTPFPIYSLFSHLTLTIPYYHIISDEDVLHVKHLYPYKKIKQFSSDIDYILKHFQPVSLAALLALLKHDTPLPRKALLLTFDDGFSQIYDVVAPILLQKGIPATFFINSSFTDNHNLCHQHKASLIVEHLLQHEFSKTVQNEIIMLLRQNKLTGTSINSCIMAIKYEQRNLIDNIADILELDFNHYLQKYQPYLTSQQIHKLISDGFAIGAHSIDHPLYKKLKLEEQILQTMESVMFVRNTFNLDYGAFAFPHSDNGVSKQYFTRIEKSGLVDISFGTSGIIEDCVRNNFQRFSMENTMMPAENILAYQYAKRLWRIIKHDTMIKRTEV